MVKGGLREDQWFCVMGSPGASLRATSEETKADPRVCLSEAQELEWLPQQDPWAGLRPFGTQPWGERGQLLVCRFHMRRPLNLREGTATSLRDES